MKKGSTATIITFVVLAVIITALSMVLNAANVNSSWMIDQAANSIMECSEEYRNMMNEMYADLAKMLADPTTFIDENYYVSSLFAGMSYEQLVAALVTPVDTAYHTAWTLMGASQEIGDLSVSAPDYVRDTFVMIGWGIVAMVAAFVAFLRREF